VSCLAFNVPLADSGIILALLLTLLAQNIIESSGLIVGAE
jgi:hypothetical protein